MILLSHVEGQHRVIPCLRVRQPSNVLANRRNHAQRRNQGHDGKGVQRNWCRKNPDGARPALRSWCACFVSYMGPLFPPRNVNAAQLY